MVRGILFVCTGNTCRSPMAQFILRKLLREQTGVLADKIEILSAGLFAANGLRPSLEAVEAMHEMAIDISGHQSQCINPALIEQADLILTMTKAQAGYIKFDYPHKQGHIFTLSEFVDQNQDIQDPFGEGSDAYLETLLKIKLCLELSVPKLIEWCGQGDDNK